MSEPEFLEFLELIKFNSGNSLILKIRVQTKGNIKWHNIVI
jgi:hypothetical protein